MTNQSFQSWLAGVDRLSDAQWSQLHAAVQERSEAARAAACGATVASAAARRSMP